MLPLMCLLRLFDGFLEHFALYYCLQSISLNFAIKAFLQIRTIPLLQHLEVSLKLIEFGIEVNCLRWPFQDGSSALSGSGWLYDGLSLRIPDD